ncbi:MFS transporter [Trametopsis cervina]|nr:MFS transporter [Trametopsis cervina]
MSHPEDDIERSPRDSEDTDVPNVAHTEKQSPSSKSKEAEAGSINDAPRSKEEQDEDDKYLVHLDAEDDPKQMSVMRKWIILIVVCSAALCATCASSMAGFAEAGVSQDFHVAKEVAILGISMYVLGLGLGPLLIGPLSEVHGRNPIYRISYFLFFATSFPVAFAPDIAVYLVFRFFTGFCSSAFLSVAGGTVSDLFDDSHVVLPMAAYSTAPLIGPAVGPLLSGFINQNTTWRWTYRVLIIWTFVEWILLLLFVPETYTPVLLKHKAKHLRKTTSDERYWAPVDRRQHSMLQAMVLSCYVPFKLLATDPMALLIDIWSALILGIQYLTFQAFPIIFEQGHGFNVQQTGLSFIGMGLGLLLGFLVQPLFTRYFRSQCEKHNGRLPPEVRLIPGQFGAVLMPVGLFWLAFTTYPHVHWIVPILASVPFGMGILMSFAAIFTFTVTAYRPIAASAMAANTFVRTASAAAFPLFAGQMYDRLGTVGATALLAGLMTLFAPLPFIFYRIGARLRAKSKFTTPPQ